MEPLYREVYSRIRSHPALRDDPSFVDLSGILDGDGRGFFFDFCHITEEGNALVAAAMVPHIRRALHASVERARVD
jgi:hypothetical protein